MAAAEDDGKGNEGGLLLIAGCMDHDAVGRKVPAAKQSSPCVPSPSIFAPFSGRKIKLVAAGPVASHYVAVDMAGQAFTWGRNDHGQCGGEMGTKNHPSVAQGMEGQQVVAASCGKNHTIFATADGESWALGSNKFGQLGIASMKTTPKQVEMQRSAVQCKTSTYKIVGVSCGGDFTLWRTEEGRLLSAGLPQYGVLGHGTDHEYNSKASSVKLTYDPQPTPKVIAKLGDREILRVACGTSHVVAVDSEGAVWTWGFGGYGRLGHREQKDEFSPRRIQLFDGRMACPKEGVVAAGSTWSAVTGPVGQIYVWGKLKLTGDNQMYPIAFMDLSGWNVRCMSSASLTNLVAADCSCIAWGTSVNGELAFGAGGPKSSANPRKVEALEDLLTLQVAAAAEFSLFLVDIAAAEAEKRFPTVEVTLEDKKAEQGGADKKRKVLAKGGGRGGSAKRGRGRGRGR